MAEEMNREAGAAVSPMVPPCPNGQLYTVKSGDSMFMIARQAGIPLSVLIAANPQIPDPNTIFPGQQLCIPGAVMPPVGCPGGFTYTVQSGDSLFAIAARFGVTLDAIKAANPQITNPDMIFPGQTVCVPGAVVPPVGCPDGFTYTVQSGDSLFAIAVRFGVTLDAIKAANPQIANPDMIFPGQTVCVPGPRPPVTCPNGTLYTIRAGDTMFDIATRFGVTLQALIAANPQITDPNRIYAGQSLCIPNLPVVPTPPAPVVISPIVSPPTGVPAVPMPPVVPVMPPPPEMAPMPVIPMPLPMPLPMPTVPPVPLPTPIMPPCLMPMPTCPMRMPCPARPPLMVEPVRQRRRHHRHHKHHRRECNY